jgi:hypothetical protein
VTLCILGKPHFQAHQEAQIPNGWRRKSQIASFAVLAPANKGGGGSATSGFFFIKSLSDVTRFSRADNYVNVLDIPILGTPSVRTADKSKADDLFSLRFRDFLDRLATQP